MNNNNTNNINNNININNNSTTTYIETQYKTVHFEPLCSQLVKKHHVRQNKNKPVIDTNV